MNYYEAYLKNHITVYIVIQKKFLIEHDRTDSNSEFVQVRILNIQKLVI
jgi:hypothetical protein